MDQLSWKSKARLVFYSQLIYLCLCLSFVILFGIVLCVVAFSNYETGFSREVNPHCACAEVKNGNAADVKLHKYWVFGVPVPPYICWIGYIVFSIATLVQLDQLFQLAKATETGTAPETAKNSARTWGNAIEVFLVLEALISAVFLLAGFITSGPLQVLCFLLFETFCIDFLVKFGCSFIVKNFINELEMPSRGRFAV